jgi:hypothetical protein
LPRAGEAGPSLASRVLDRPGRRFWLNISIALMLLALAAWAIRRRRR